MKKFAVILAGCGVYDGAEIHEAVLTLLAIQKNGASYQIFAPDINQHHVVNHLTGKETGETRNVLAESARIARGKIKNVTEYNPADFDALVFPGGFGVAKNLFTFAFDGANAKVNADVEKAVTTTHKAGKPIGAVCIAPALLAKIIPGATVTIGTNPDTIANIEKMNAIHVKSQHGQAIVDEKNKLVTGPCYMLESSLVDIAADTDAMVKEILKLVK